MKYRINFSLIVCILIIYILNQLWLKNLGVLFFNYYLNDLLAVPLYFALINIICELDNKKMITSFKYLLVITIALAFIGEYLAVYFRPNSVTDFWDIVCYFIGMIFYYIIINHNKFTVKNKL